LFTTYGGLNAEGASLTDIQLLFTCNDSGDRIHFEKVATLELIQADCFKRGLRGFFLPHNNHYTGLLEGNDTQVIRQIEKLVRSGHFQNINVIREYLPKQKVCQTWYVGNNIPDEVAVESFLLPEYLAEFVASTLKPLEMHRRQ
jgi:hypothetical protein